MAGTLQELGQLVWKITGDTSDIKKQLASTEKGVKGFAKKVKGVLKTLGFVAVAAGIAKVSKELISSASDAEEAQNAVNVTFKEGSVLIQDFAKTTATSVGLSSTAFKELSTVIGAQLKQSGKPIQDVAKDTIDLTKRASDLASVFNVEVSEATTALGSALRGEAEPARRFGINISDAAVQAEALASGLVSSKKENKLVAIDTDTGKKKELALSPAPYHLNTINSIGKVYVSSRKKPIIWVVDQKTLKVINTIKLPAGEAHQMAIVDE